MQTKWLEDLIALAQTRSFSRAAELRHVTHPAFGRRIQALEAWAGTALVDRGEKRVKLTVAGEKLLGYARQAVPSVTRVREDIRGAAGQGLPTVTLATGRTLARTITADLLVRLRRQLAGARVVVRTGHTAETLRALESGEVDFMLSYHHPLIAARLSSHQFLQRTVGRDKLVPVCRLKAQGQPAFSFQPGQPVPLLAYAETLALGRLVRDHLSNHAGAPALREAVECDSADALLEYALKGLGVAWLPWSLAAGACKARQLAPMGGKTMEIAFDIRMVRAKRALSAAAETVWSAVDPA